MGWNYITLPVSEGGLGVRDLTQTMHALHSKFAWKLINHSLGGFHAPKGRPTLVLQQGIPSQASHFCKAFMSHLLAIV